MRFSGRTLLCAAVSVAAICTTLPSPSASAQTGSTPQPTATVTATPSPTAGAGPAPNDLLTAARAAFTRANTSHFDVLENLHVGGLLQGSVREQGAESLRPSRIRAHVTGALTTLGKLKKLNEWHVQIGQKAWVKSAATKGRWATEKPTSTSATDSVQSPLDLAEGNGVTLSNLQTVGAETFNGVPVWHVHGTATAQVTQTTSATGTVDYLIAQSGSLPYRILEYISDPKNALLLDLRITLSGFGRKVTIKTPKVGGTLR